MMAPGPGSGQVSHAGCGRRGRAAPSGAHAQAPGRGWPGRDRGRGGPGPRRSALGYLSYDARAADLLFQVVSRRYERRSLVLTTNLAFSDWLTIFPNAGSAIALIDRLIHHAEIIAIEGESYRRRAAEAARKAPRSTPTS